MKPEQKVVSIPIAKRMQELGWDVETERMWVLQKAIGDFPEVWVLEYAEEWTCHRNNSLVLFLA